MFGFNTSFFSFLAYLTIFFPSSFLSRYHLALSVTHFLFPYHITSCPIVSHSASLTPSSIQVIVTNLQFLYLVYFFPKKQKIFFPASLHLVLIFHDRFLPNKSVLTFLSTSKRFLASWFSIFFSSHLQQAFLSLFPHSFFPFFCTG